MDFDNLARQFLSERKQISKKPAWKRKNRADFVEMRAELYCETYSRTLRGTLVIVAPRLYESPKYSFSIIFRGARVLALDVDPKRFHRNILSGISVSGTHWQRHPNMDVAIPDSRSMPFPNWLEEFLRDAQISSSYAIKAPPYGVQLEMNLDQ